MPEVQTDWAESRLRALAEQPPANREDAQRALDLLAGELGMDALTLDDKGAAELLVQGDLRLSLTWVEGQPGIIVAAPMPSALARDPGALAMAMQANGSWSVTQGAVFALVPGTGTLALCRHLLMPDPSQVDAGRALADQLSAFAALARAWIGALVDRLGEGDAPGDPPSAGPLSPPGILRP